MKEVLLLPTTNEALFQPLQKQLEKRPQPEEGMSFRDYLEQAKSAPEKPSAKGIDPKPGQVQQDEPKAPLPSDEAKMEVEEEDSPPKVTDDSQASAASAVPLEAALAVVALNDLAIIPMPLETSAASIKDGNRMDSLTEMAVPNLGSTADLLLMNSVSDQPKATEASINTSLDNAFAQLLQTQNETAPSANAIEEKVQAVSQPKVNVDSEISEEVNKGNIPQPAVGSKETGKVTISQTTEAISGKIPEVPAKIAQDRASSQSMVAEVNRLKESESQLPVAKEGAKPEIAQASGPPLNSTSAKPIEPARLAEAHRPEIVQQVARELEVFGKSGQTSLRIQLYPEQLGRIDVRLISKAEGVQIVLHADNPSTAFLLERDLNNLRESLVQAGVNLSGLTVGHGQAQNRSDLAQSEFRSPNRNPATFGNAAQQHESSASSSERRWRDSSSTVDYRI
ncbi:MAG: flagellar hook-length control protein FliK [Anaerolineales bacterium]|nr:flagellar hook-length control protein FliK [Anaerolineales bacterium]